MRPELLGAEAAELDHHRQPAEELGDHAELEEVFVCDPPARVCFSAAPADEAEAARALVVHVQVAEGAGADEEDVCGVDLDEVVLVPVLGHVERDEDLASFEQLEQRLLHAFTADVAAAGAGARAVAASGDLVDLVDEDDAPLRLFDGVVGLEEELGDHDLHVLAVITGFGVLGGVDDSEGDTEAGREVAGDVGLSAAGGADEQDVGLPQQSPPLPPERRAA